MRHLFLVALLALPLACGVPSPGRTAATLDVGPDLCMGSDMRPEKDSRPWWRYVLVAALVRLDQDSGLQLTPREARLIADRLERMDALGTAADYLWQHGYHRLTPVQQRFLRTVRLPHGVCTCPCASWNPVVAQAMDLVRRRAGSPDRVEPLALPETFPPEEKDIPPGLQYVQALVEMDRQPAVRLSPEQAGEALRLLTLLVGALDTIEQDNRVIWSRVSPRERRWMLEHGDEWLGNRTGEDLEGVWEVWLKQAVFRLRAVEAAG